MSDYFPEDIWPMILLKLPLKSIVQCTSVCKTWRSLITSSTFIATHLSVSRRRPLLLTTSTQTMNTQTFSLHFDTDPFPISRNLHCPFDTALGIAFRVVGSVDGLICLSDDILNYHYTFIIWNPSIRRSVLLPRPSYTFDEIGPYHFAIGFGFDSAKNVYKVVRVVYVHGNRRFGGYGAPLVEVYSLGEQSWRAVRASGGVSVKYCIPELAWSQCFIHGAVHWVAGGSRNVVLLFHLGNEVLKTMELPESLVRVCLMDLSIGVTGGLLSIFEHAEGLNIWVKRVYAGEGSWTKMITISEKWEVGLALHLRRIGSEILLESCGGDISGKVEYECKDLQLSAKYFGRLASAFFALSFPESLVLLDRESGANTYTGPKDEEGIERQDT